MCRVPSRVFRPCKERYCNVLTNDKTGYCPEHIHLAEELKKQSWKRHDALRKSARERGYDSRWEKIRKIFLMNNPLCVDCLKDGRLTPAKVVDHIKPHRGNKELFWDESNWQSLCVMHHNKKTARGE